MGGLGLLGWRWLFLSIPMACVLILGARQMATSWAGWSSGAALPPPSHSRQYLFDENDGTWMRYDLRGQAWENAPGPPLNLQAPDNNHHAAAVTHTVTQQHTVTVASGADSSAPAGYVNPFPPPEDTPERQPDVQDTFVDYIGHDKCGVSSRDLHVPFSPLCTTRDTLLEAMSTGGRAGYDEPFIPHGCDMRWYTTQEIAEILNRFSYIFIVGDSIQRHLLQAIYILVRADLEFGSTRDWDLQRSLDQARADDPTVATIPETKEECACEVQFTRHDCSNVIIQNSDDLWGNASASMPYSHSALETNIQFHWFTSWPFFEIDLEKMTRGLPQQRPSKPMAAIVHHTLWNDVNATETEHALEDWLTQFRTDIPWLARGAYFPRLFTTINAGGLAKGLGFVETQGNQKLGNFEYYMKDPAARLGYEFLGMYNMSIQSSSRDGSHASYQTNIIKAMMVMNWLAHLDVDEWNQ